MDSRLFPEASLHTLEKMTGLKITVIDNDGILCYKQGRPVFSPYFSSHCKNEPCRIGFCDKCIENCRFLMNRRCLDEAEPFLSVCWKGLTQLVIPLRHGNTFYGMLYAGLWRTKNAHFPEGLPKSFGRAFGKVPLLDKRKGKELIPLLAVHADGLVYYLRKIHAINDEYDFRRKTVEDFLERNFQRSFGISELAEALGRSPSHASVMVRRLFGIPFSQLLRRKRLEKVETYLASTDFSLHEIAGRCGFSGEFHLGKVFRSVRGIPPGRFRRELRKNPLSG